MGLPNNFLRNYWRWVCSKKNTTWHCRCSGVVICESHHLKYIISLLPHPHNSFHCYSLSEILELFIFYLIVASLWCNNHFFHIGMESTGIRVVSPCVPRVSFFPGRMEYIRQMRNCFHYTYTNKYVSNIKQTGSRQRWSWIFVRIVSKGNNNNIPITCFLFVKPNTEIYKLWIMNTTHV